jgi:hypothetical protein
MSGLSLAPELLCAWMYVLCIELANLFHSVFGAYVCVCAYACVCVCVV